jgi:hypothetical protein
MAHEFRLCGLAKLQYRGIMSCQVVVTEEVSNGPRAIITATTFPYSVYMIEGVDFFSVECWLAEAGAFIVPYRDVVADRFPDAQIVAPVEFLLVGPVRGLIKMR